MLFITDRGTPEGHDHVADVFVDSAPVFEDQAGHRGEVLIEKPLQFVGAQGFGDGGETAYVGKQYR